MNQRIILILSVVIIAVGIVGIIRQKSGDGAVAKAAPQSISKSIIYAEAVNDLYPGDIINSNSYVIKSQTVTVDNGDYKDAKDLSALGSDLSGFLIRTKVAQGEAILPAVLEKPGTPGYLKHGLNSEYSLYGVPIRKGSDEYLLTSLTAGSRVAIYLRAIKKEKVVSSTPEVSSDGTPPGSQKNEDNKYFLKRIFNNVVVMDVSKLDKEKTNEKSSWSNKEPIVGNVAVRLNNKQFVEIKTIENIWDIVITPEVKAEDYLREDIHQDEVLPQFKAIKELRGNSNGNSNGNEK